MSSPVEPWERNGFPWLKGSLPGRAGEQASAPFETWDYAPPYLPEGMSIQMAASSGAFDEPLLFVVPNRPPKNLPIDLRPPLQHKNGARGITRLSMTLPERHTAYSPALSEVLKLGFLNIANATKPLLEVILDEGRAGRSLDARPQAPVIVHW